MTLKRISVLCAVAIAVSSLTLVNSSAAERPTSVAGCAKPTAKAHAPATLKQPTVVDKKLAKTMTINTNCGVITIALNPAAPQTVTNLATLARAKYFDGSFCHRLTTEGIYVLQCGDPSAGKGINPVGWKEFQDENLPAATEFNYPYHCYPSLGAALWNHFSYLNRMGSPSSVGSSSPSK